MEIAAIQQPRKALETQENKERRQFESNLLLHEDVSKELQDEGLPPPNISLTSISGIALANQMRSAWEHLILKSNAQVRGSQQFSYSSSNLPISEQSYWTSTLNCDSRIISTCLCLSRKCAWRTNKLFLLSAHPSCIVRIALH